MATPGLPCWCWLKMDLCMWIWKSWAVEDRHENGSSVELYNTFPCRPSVNKSGAENGWMGSNTIAWHFFRTLCLAGARYHCCLQRKRHLLIHHHAKGCASALEVNESRCSDCYLLTHPSEVKEEAWTAESLNAMAAVDLSAQLVPQMRLRDEPRGWKPQSARQFQNQHIEQSTEAFLCWKLDRLYSAISCTVCSAAAWRCDILFFHAGV